MENEGASRRRFVATVAGLSVIGLSGCGSDDSGTPSPTATDTETATATATPMEGVTPSDQSTPTEAPSATTTETQTDAQTEAQTDAQTETQTDAPTPTATPSAGELSEWPTYMYNNQNWGNNPDAVGPDGEVSVLWERDLGGQVNATAALANGTLYVGEGAPNDDEGLLYALNPLTGETEWTAEFGAPVTGGAAVDDDGVIYVAAGRERVALKSDGSRRWRSRINPSPNYAPTTVAGDYVYFAADSGRIVRIDKRTSGGDWEYFVSSTVESAPIVTDGRVYLGSRDGTVTALTESGNEEWVQNFDEPVNGLSMRDDRLYAALESNEVVQIDTEKRIRWRGSLDSGVATTPAVAGDFVYVGLRDDAFVALDRAEGFEQWRFDGVDDPFTASPVVVDGTVYAGNQNGSVYALDAETGEAEWSYELGGEIRNPAPVVAGGTVYIGARDGTFYALRG